MKKFETKVSEGLSVIPESPNIFEYVNYSKEDNIRDIIEDLICGFNSEIRYYRKFYDTLFSKDLEEKKRDIKWNIQYRTFARPLFELCFDSDIEDPEKMFLLTKYNNLYLRGIVVPPGSKLWFDGRIELPEGYKEIKTNFVKAKTNMMRYTYYGYMNYNENKNFSHDKHYKIGCEILGINPEIKFNQETYEPLENEGHIRKIRIYKVLDNNFKKDAENYLITDQQSLDYLENNEVGKRCFKWDLPLVKIDKDIAFGSIILEDKDEEFNERLPMLENIINEISGYDSFEGFLYHQHERLLEFLKNLK